MRRRSHGEVEGVGLSPLEGDGDGLRHTATPWLRGGPHVLLLIGGGCLQCIPSAPPRLIARRVVGVLDGADGRPIPRLHAPL